MVDKEEDTLTVGLMTTDDTPAMDSTKTPITDKDETDRNTEPLNACTNYGAERRFNNSKQSTSSWRKQKIRPIKAQNDNGTINVDGKITEKCLITLDIQGRHLTEQFYATTPDDQSLILELLWLEKHDPMMISDRRL